MNSPEGKQTQMVAPQAKQTKMVKIRAVYPIRLTNSQGVETIIQPKQEVEVTEAEAQEYCDRVFDLGHKQEFGTRDSSLPTMKVKRAERVA